MQADITIANASQDVTKDKTISYHGIRFTADKNGDGPVLTSIQNADLKLSKDRDAYVKEHPKAVVLDQGSLLVTQPIMLVSKKVGDVCSESERGSIASVKDSDSKSYSSALLECKYNDYGSEICETDWCYLPVVNMKVTYDLGLQNLTTFDCRKSGNTNFAKYNYVEIGSARFKLDSGAGSSQSQDVPTEYSDPVSFGKTFAYHTVSSVDDKNQLHFVTCTVLPTPIAPGWLKNGAGNE